MRRIFFLLITILTVSTASNAQKSAEALEKDNKSLQERFKIMKDKSETFTDYKVIRLYVLDGMWKITMDSLQAQKDAIRQANNTISKLEGELKSINVTLKNKDGEMEKMEHASTHITVFGIDVLKSVFLSTVGIVNIWVLVFVGIVF
jgi:hypothetical protein